MWAVQWIYQYNVPPNGSGDGGEEVWEKLRKVGVEVPQEFALFMPMILDRISADWTLDPGNDLLAQYNS